MNKIWLVSICLLSVFSCTAIGLPSNVDETQQVPTRIVAIGDIHGDYDQFVKLLRLTGLINKQNKWIGGKTHLIQMGDIPDRGPDTRKAMDLLMALEKSSLKDGGAVTVLIGNHEAMNMTDDLRYVHPGEYAAFKDKDSVERRKFYYQKTIKHITMRSTVDELPIFDNAYQDQWMIDYPLGYFEHRVAWAPTGKYGKWVLSRKVIVKVGDTIFLHGGISEKYATMSISELNTRSRTELADPTKVTKESVVEDTLGPLWYRGWARLVQTAENEAVLDQILEGYGAKRMVIAHTPLLSVVLPRFAGKVLMVDVGLSAHYGNGLSALEISDGKAYTIIAEHKLPLPSDMDGIETYLDAIYELNINRDRIEAYRLDQKAKLLESTLEATEAVN